MLCQVVSCSQAPIWWACQEHKDQPAEVWCCLHQTDPWEVLPRTSCQDHLQQLQHWSSYQRSEPVRLVVACLSSIWYSPLSRHQLQMLTDKDFNLSDVKEAKADSISFSEAEKEYNSDITLIELQDIGADATIPPSRQERSPSLPRNLMMMECRHLWTILPGSPCRLLATLPPFHSPTCSMPSRIRTCRSGTRG